MSARAWIVPLVLAAFASRQEPAALPALAPGDPAPELKVAEWIQGEPVTAFQRGKPYVVELWCSSHPTSRRSIPGLDELYRKHKEQGLAVVGVSIWEREADIPKIAPFVKSLGERLSFSVARDDVPAGDARGQRGFMALHWMKAAGQQAVPAAFVIDREGRVAWIGAPEELGQPVAAVVAGQWDLAAARAQFLRARELEARTNEISARIEALRKKGDYKGAAALLDELVALDPRNAVRTAAMRFDWLLKSKDLDAAYAWARTALEGEVGQDAGALNAIAWMIVDPRRTDLERRDLELALAAARKAAELSAQEDPNLLDTLARVHFLRGELEQAIAVQEKAVGLASEEAQRASLQRTLDEYKRGAKR